MPTIELSLAQQRIDTDGHTISQVIEALNKRLRDLGEDDELYYYSFSDMAKYEVQAGRCSPYWPPSAWIACFPVRGSNEGYYVHIEALERTGHRRLLALAKLESNGHQHLAARLASEAFLMLEA